MKLLLLILLSFPTLTFASLPELFGSSAGSIAVGNQAAHEDAGNNYYAAALLGFSKKIMFSFNSYYIASDFKDVDNVVLKNDTNTIGNFSRGKAEINNTPTLMLGAHLSVPLLYPEGPKLNFSFISPSDRLLETDSGDPYQPRYVMYDNRFIRPFIMFSLAQSFGSWAFSLGAQNSFQSNGESYFVTRTTAGDPSLSRVAFNAKPSLGITASVAKQHENKSVTYLAFQQEMKSRFYNRATGQTEIGGGASFPFDFQISSLLYYDPMTFRLGHQRNWSDSNLYLSLEYQDWESYSSSTLKLQKKGGTINGSSNFENMKLRNILIPKIGYAKKLHDRWTAKAGYFYRPSPLRPEGMKGAGNSLDADKHVGSLGLAYDFLIMGKRLTLDTAYQAHYLESFKVKKIPGREDGDPAQPKIGSPGYRVGGMIHVLSIGLSWML